MKKTGGILVGRALMGDTFGRFLLEQATGNGHKMNHEYPDGFHLRAAITAVLDSYKGADNSDEIHRLVKRELLTVIHTFIQPGVRCPECRNERVTYVGVPLDDRGDVDETADPNALEALVCPVCIGILFEQVEAAEA